MILHYHRQNQDHLCDQNEDVESPNSHGFLLLSSSTSESLTVHSNQLSSLSYRWVCSHHDVQVAIFSSRLLLHFLIRPWFLSASKIISTNCKRLNIIKWAMINITFSECEILLLDFIFWWICFFVCWGQAMILLLLEMTIILHLHLIVCWRHWYYILRPLFLNLYLS